MNTHVGNILERLSLLEGVAGGGHHLAHIVGLLSQNRVTLATASKITALLAPESGRVVPLEGFLAGGVAHTTIIVLVVGQTCRHLSL